MALQVDIGSQYWGEQSQLLEGGVCRGSYPHCLYTQQDTGDTKNVMWATPKLYEALRRIDVSYPLHESKGAYCYNEPMTSDVRLKVDEVSS